MLFMHGSHALNRGCHADAERLACPDAPYSIADTKLFPFLVLFYTFILPRYLPLFGNYFGSTVGTGPGNQIPRRIRPGILENCKSVSGGIRKL